MTQHDESHHFDPEAVHAKYKEEREKRMVEGRAAIRDLRNDETFKRYTADPFTPYIERDPVADDVDVAIIGAGMAGILAGAKLREAGIERIRLFDEAGGVGGTWYWNRYPGVMCDVESYIYMPMLEELGYIPKRRYAFGDEIREHFERIADKFGLVEAALFHTAVVESRWDESLSRWILRTDRGDEITARYLVLAVGILHRMKLPVIPGMEDFQGKSFHSARWDYEYTGGDLHGNLHKLSDKVVGIIGTGASAIQIIPHLAESAKHLYVFQRTPSAVGVRGNRPTEEEWARSLSPGWQRERMDNFTAVMIGREVARDLVDDSWTHHMAKVANPAVEPGMGLEDIMRAAEEFDFSVMEEHRARVADTVSDPRTAEVLKPYYRYLCKRPCFHDEYLPAFNRPNVTLVDCPAGIDRVTERGVAVNGEGFELDLIVYATGFEAELTPLARRAGHPIVGLGGVTIAEKWEHGVSTLHGFVTRGFPNLFLMPAPGQQAVTTVSITHLNVTGAEHIAQTIALLEERGVTVFDVDEDAEQAWVDTIVSSYTDASAFMASCTPSRLNFEGNPGAANPRNGSYGGRYGDFFGWRDIINGWRENDFPGLELDASHDDPV